ncbi:hypothetical protein, partial [Pseudomonas rhodesiae]|uniref:hypothetical protein n=1 Tax=Pseudomonas rhodesiae TaxID=76760 RepID=UPI00264A1A8C
ILFGAEFTQFLLTLQQLLLQPANLICQYIPSRPRQWRRASAGRRLENARKLECDKKWEGACPR